MVICYSSVSIIKGLNMWPSHGKAQGSICNLAANDWRMFFSLEARSMINTANWVYLSGRGVKRVGGGAQLTKGFDLCLWLELSFQSPTSVCGSLSLYFTAFKYVSFLQGLVCWSSHMSIIHWKWLCCGISGHLLPHLSLAHALLWAAAVAAYGCMQRCHPCRCANKRALSRFFVVTHK